MTTTSPPERTSVTSRRTSPAIRPGGISAGLGADAGMAATSRSARGSPIQPGTTHATRTPNRSSQSATAVVRRIRPALATAYSGES